MAVTLIRQLDQIFGAQAFGHRDHTGNQFIFNFPAQLFKIIEAAVQAQIPGALVPVVVGGRDVLSFADLLKRHGGLHAMMWDDARLLAHASLVQRCLLLGDRPSRVGYVEGTAVHPDHWREGLGAAFRLLKSKGRIAVISFHSGEDRIVKQTFRALSSGCVCPPRLAICACGQKPVARVVTRKGVRATDAEIENNPRARSAVLRAMEKLAAEDNHDG